MVVDEVGRPEGVEAVAGAHDQVTEVEQGDGRRARGWLDVDRQPVGGPPQVEVDQAVADEQPEAVAVDRGDRRHRQTIAAEPTSGWRRMKSTSVGRYDGRGGHPTPVPSRSAWVLALR